MRQKTKTANCLSDKELPDISVHKLANGKGYCLKFEGTHNDYLYFSVEDLLKGFMIHIGLRMTDMLDLNDINHFIESAVNFHTNKACIDEIQRLNKHIYNINRSRNWACVRLIAARDNLVKLVSDIDRLAYEYRERTSLSSRLRSIIRRFANTKPLTMKDLGISAMDIKDLPEEDEEDET